MTPIPLGPARWTFDRSRWPDDDCVAVGADLEPETVVAAYRAGAFPMPVGGLLRSQQIAWWSPVQRGVLPLDALHVSRSLGRACRRFTITIDTAFADVVRGCADPSRRGAWIDDQIFAAYVRLHELGWAHSIEVRTSEGDLAGGLYGLAIGGLFAGESMFHRERDASKVALVGLVDALRDAHADRRLIDVQWQTTHLATLGVTTWPRERYLDRLGDLAAAPLPAQWS